MTPLDEHLRHRIEQHGPVGFDDVMEAALYDPEHGFFATHGRSGTHRGDFVTSPAVGPLFGQLVARRLDREWERLGRPNSISLVDAGAGTGLLAKSVLAARPECREVLTVVCVERSVTQQAQHPEGCASLDHLPDGPLEGLLIANELLDNMPFRLVERRDGDWVELRVTWNPRDQRLVHHPVSLPPEANALVHSLAPDASDGARLPVQARAAAWVSDALERLRAGSLVVLDYSSTSRDLARCPMEQWVRTYRRHERGTDPLLDPGSQDITVEVAVDQLPEADHVSDQAGWLRGLGIDALVEEGRRVWAERAHLGDLEAMRARSRVREAEALTDPAGLGGFTVLEYHR